MKRTEIADELDRCVARTHGLELVMQAICGDNPGDLYQGAWQLVQDLGSVLRDLSDKVLPKGETALFAISPPLATAIERHKNAYATMVMKDDVDKDDSESSRIDDAAALAVAMAPVANEFELLEKLRYLLNYEKALWREPQQGTEFGLVSMALDDFFNPKKGNAQADATA